MAEKTIDELAEQASRETSRWYGRTAHFNAPPVAWHSCKEWFLQHWRAFPRHAPKIEDGP